MYSLDWYIRMLIWADSYTKQNGTWNTVCVVQARTSRSFSTTTAYANNTMHWTPVLENDITIYSGSSIQYCTNLEHHFHAGKTFTLRFLFLFPAIWPFPFGKTPYISFNSIWGHINSCLSKKIELKNQNLIVLLMPSTAGVSFRFILSFSYCFGLHLVPSIITFKVLWNVF